MATEGRPWAVCAVRARAGALCFAPDGEKLQNSRHKRTTPANTALRSRAARARRIAVAQPRRRERLAGARRERGVGVSDPELHQHTETPAVIKVAAVVADAAVPTAAAATTATVSGPSHMAPHEERAERRSSARTRRPRRQRPPYEHAMRRARAGSRLVAGVVCGRPEYGVRSRDGWTCVHVTPGARRSGQLLSRSHQGCRACNGHTEEDKNVCKRNDSQRASGRALIVSHTSTKTGKRMFRWLSESSWTNLSGDQQLEQHQRDVRAR